MERRPIRLPRVLVAMVIQAVVARMSGVKVHNSFLPRLLGGRVTPEAHHVVVDVGTLEVVVGAREGGRVEGVDGDAAVRFPFHPFPEAGVPLEHLGRGRGGGGREPDVGEVLLVQLRVVEVLDAGRLPLQSQLLALLPGHGVDVAQAVLRAALLQGRRLERSEVNLGAPVSVPVLLRVRLEGAEGPLGQRVFVGGVVGGGEVVDGFVLGQAGGRGGRGVGGGGFFFPGVHVVEVLLLQHHRRTLPVQHHDPVAHAQLPTDTQGRGSSERGWLPEGQGHRAPSLRAFPFTTSCTQRIRHAHTFPVGHFEADLAGVVWLFCFFSSPPPLPPPPPPPPPVIGYH